MIRDAIELVAGVDEAGRGPLAGPVAAAAVILDPRNTPCGLADSKLLSPADRETVFAEIAAKALAISFALLPPAEIDRLNIRGAALEAMRRAVAGLAIRPHRVIIDGRDIPPGISSGLQGTGDAGLALPCEAIIQGDATEPAISAASIVAKVMRDRLMARLGLELPAYGFEIHKGYPTAKHRSVILSEGPCVHHRRSFAPFKNGTA